jgi:hypothetical protein
MPFEKGDAGGPGRPRKKVERRYLQSLIGCVPLRRWRQVVCKALEDAEQGDAKARDWLSRHLVGSEPLLMLELADRLEQLEEQERQRAEREKA